MSIRRRPPLPLRRYRGPTLFVRLQQLCTRAWRNLRFRWYIADKGPWIFICVLVAAVVTLGYFVHVVLAYELERREMTCLALNVYFEARGEPLAGQYAVAEVTMNRVASPIYPNTICGVVYQRNWDSIRRRYVGAFSWTEFDTRRLPRGEEWQRAQRVAKEVYYGEHPSTVKGALFYHSIYIKPSWAAEKKPVARIGEHVFYR